MNTTIEYRCKFCGVNRKFTCDVDDNCPSLDLEKWKAMMVCDSCADYERSRRDLEERVRMQAISLKTVRMQFAPGHSKLETLEQRCRDNLIYLTKELGKVISKRNNKPFMWEPVMVDYILKYPDKHSEVVNRYRRTMEVKS